MTNIERVYLIGADPELFVMVKGEGGALLSAHDLVPGNKIAPCSVKKGAIQPDGTSAEFNIHPAQTAKEFTDNIKSVLLELQAVVQKNAKELYGKDVQLKVTPTAWFDQTYFKHLSPEAKVFGCTPDWNAWTTKQTPFVGTNKPFRTGAGHIHIGWTDNQDTTDDAHWFDCLQAVKQLDCSLYFSSLLWDKDNTRRILYGKMGAFRPKSYGVEYRPLSNAWVADPDLHEFVFETARASMLGLDKFDDTYFDDVHTMSLVERTLHNTPVSRAELLAWHKNFTLKFNLPMLPERYLAA
jgi:hypothetical protein